MKGVVILKKVKAKLKPYNQLTCNFTKISNSMFFYIKDIYDYRVYAYLCIRYNSNYNYAFPSYSTIATDCNISLSKAKQCIKSLCQQGYIVKAKYNNGGNVNNIYYIRYLEIDEIDLEKHLETEITIDVEFNYNIDCIDNELEVELQI